MEDTYREIREYVSNMYHLMRFLGDIGNAKGKIDMKYFQNMEECYKRLPKTPNEQSEKLGGLAIIAAETSTEQFKFILKDIFGIKTIFSDDVLLDFLLSVKMLKDEDNALKALSLIFDDKFAIEKGEIVKAMATTSVSFIPILQIKLHTVCLAKKMEDIKEEFESFLCEAYGVSKQLTANYIFGNQQIEATSQEDEDDINIEDMREKWDIIHFLLEKSGYKYTNNSKIALFMSKLCGGNSEHYRRRIIPSYVTTSRGKQSSYDRKGVEKAKETLRRSGIEPDIQS